MSWYRRDYGPFAVLALTAPPANHLGLADLAELEGRLRGLAADETIKIIVLTGEPAGRYIGHADLEDVTAVRERTAGPHPFERWVLTPLAIEDAAQPVIAAVDAPARGGGSELALACTFRVGTPDASFTQHEITRGAMPGAGATQRLPRLIGPSRAARALMTGETIESEEALRLGLFDHVVTGGDFIEGVLAWAAPLAAQPRASLVAIKQAMLAGTRAASLDGLMREHRLFHELLTGRTEA